MERKSVGFVPRQGLDLFDSAIDKRDRCIKPANIIRRIAPHLDEFAVEALPRIAALRFFPHDPAHFLQRLTDANEVQVCAVGRGLAAKGRADRSARSEARIETIEFPLDFLFCRIV